MDDQRIEAAFDAAAPAVDTGQVVDRVATKRARRRRNHRLVTTTSALVVVLLVVVGTVLLARDDTSAPQVAAPGAARSVRIITGDDATVDGRTTALHPVRLDADPGVLVGPLSVGSTALSIASHDQGSDGVPLTHVVRVEGTHVLDVVNLKAAIISIAEGEGARWALTRNLRATGGTLPDTFLKRIGATGDPVSVMLPVDSDPVGPVAAVGGAVWVPLRDGVLQYDPVTLALVRRITLPSAAAREVAQTGKSASVPDGGTLVRLDPAGGAAGATDFGPDIIGLAANGGNGSVLLRNEQGGTERARVAQANSAVPLRVTAVLPRGFRPDRLEASSTRLWVTGTVDDSPAIVLLGDRGVVATVVVPASRDAALAWSAPDTVSVVTDGGLFTISLS